MANLIERAELMYHECFPGLRLPYAFCSIIVLYVEDRGRCMYAGYTHVREMLEPWAPSIATLSSTLR